MAWSKVLRGEAKESRRIVLCRYPGLCSVIMIFYVMKKQKSGKRRCHGAARVLLTLLLVFCLAVTSVFATPRTQQEINDDINETKEQIEQKNEEKETIESEMTDLQGQIGQTKASIDALSEEISTLQQEIQDTKDKLEQQEQEIEEEETNLDNRLRNMYKNGTLGFVDVIVSSESVTDLMSNISMVWRIYNGDKELIGQLEDQHEKTEATRAELEDQEEELNVKYQELDQVIIGLYDTYSVMEADKATVDAATEDLQDQLTQLNNERPAPPPKPVTTSVIQKSSTAATSSGSVTASTGSGDGGSGSASPGGGLAAVYGMIGVPYVWGGVSPTGVDCSGLVCLCYGYGRGRTTWQMIASLKSTGSWKTAMSQLAVGDLVFPSDGHVGVYIGNGQMIHAPYPGQVVQISSVYSFIGGGTY